MINHQESDWLTYERINVYKRINFETKLVAESFAIKNYFLKANKTIY